MNCCSCHNHIHAKALQDSESGSLNPFLRESMHAFSLRKSVGVQTLQALLEKTDPGKEEIVWQGGDCEVCSPRNGKAFGLGWDNPPPLHPQCDCFMYVRKRRR